MEEKRICKNCIYFPCIKIQCEIGQKGCNEFGSTIQAVWKGIKENKL